MLVIGDEHQIESRISDKICSLQSKEVLELSSGKDSVHVYVDHAGDVVMSDSDTDSVDIIVALRKLGPEFHVESCEGGVHISRVKYNNLRQTIGEALIM